MNAAQVTHTPGPWFISEEPRGIETIRQEETGYTVCEFPYGAEEGVELANARLIAAAPTLLEALRELSDCHESGKHPPQRMWAVALIAIASAIGAQTSEQQQP